MKEEILKEVTDKWLKQAEDLHNYGYIIENENK